MAKKLLLLKPQRLRNLFLSFSYYNFEETVTDFEVKSMFRKESLTYKQNF